MGGFGHYVIKAWMQGALTGLVLASTFPVMLLNKQAYDDDTE